MLILWYRISYRWWKGWFIIEKQENDKKEEGLNKALYNGMNGKPVPLWKFILGIILVVIGVLGAISVVL